MMDVNESPSTPGELLRVWLRKKFCRGAKHKLVRFQRASKKLAVR